MKNTYVCYSYYHVLVSVLKVLKGKAYGQDDIIITDQIPNYSILYNNLKKSSIFKNVIFIDDQNRSEKYFHNKNIFYKINFVLNYRKSIIKMFPDVKVNGETITIYFDRQHLSQFFILNYNNIILSEDGKLADDLFIYKKNTMRRILERLGVIVKMGGYPESISKIECGNMEFLPQELKYKFKKIDFCELSNDLNEHEKIILCNIFSLKVKEYSKNSCIILTQALFIDGYLKSEEEQEIFYKKIREAILEKYENVYIKPHPRDETNYEKYFEKYEIICKNVPFELFNILSMKFIRYITTWSTSIAEIDPNLVIKVNIEDVLNENRILIW